MTKLISLIVFSFVVGCSVSGKRLPSQTSNSKYGLHAQPLSLENRALKNSKSFWKIIPYYRGQKTSSSCSLASATVVVNALIPSHTLPSSSKLFTEESVLKIANSKRWRRATAIDGSGLSLKQMHEELENLITRLKLKDKYELKTLGASKSFRDSLKMLEAGKSWIIVNFDQGMLMGEESAGHFSPIGAYDEATDRVLILDTDAEWYEPYWVSVDLLLKSIDTSDSTSGAKRGFHVITSKDLY